MRELAGPGQTGTLGVGFGAKHMDLQNNGNDQESRLTRIEKALELFIENSSGEHKQLLTAQILMNDALLKITGVVQTLTGTVERITGTVERITGTVERITGTVERIAGAVEEITGHIEKLTDRMDRVEAQIEALVAVVDGLVRGRPQSS